jgi:hypothetical protein
VSGLELLELLRAAITNTAKYAQVSVVRVAVEAHEQLCGSRSATTAEAAPIPMVAPVCSG